MLQCYTEGMEVHQSGEAQQVHNIPNPAKQNQFGDHIYILITL